MESPTQHIELNVKGMTCTNCALGIEKYLKQEGLDGVSVDFSNEEVQFELDPAQASRLPQFIKGIEGLGFQVVKDEAEGAAEGMSKVERFFWLSLIFTFPLLLHMFIPWHVLHNPWVQLGLATPVFLLGMYHFGRSGWNSLKTGVPNMDVLVTIGALSAYGYSLYGTLAGLGPDFLFYETAASIITIVLLGNVMEHRAVRRTTTAVRSLMDLQPATAHRVDCHGGQESLVAVPVAQLRRGDLLQVNTGERIPVDGLIREGQGEIDESMLSGESLTREAGPGEKIIGGTVLVSGSLRIEATEVGKGTVLAKIINMVKQAQADKPGIQQLADRISAIFVPAVLSIAALTFVLSFWAFDLGLQKAVIHSVAVLVIACPCAMGLATPTAVVVGIGRASKLGILIKGGRTLEQFARIRRVVFDKTGTLTTGDFSLAAIHCAPEEAEAVRSVILSLEQHSTHPVAHSLRRALAGHAPAPMAQVRETKGLGLQGQGEDGHSYQLGSFRLAQGLTGDLDHSLFLLRDGQVWATIDLEDEVRPEARAAIDYLHEQGIETVLLSGDRQAKCEAVARQLGIDQVYAEQLPQDKLQLIGKFAGETDTAMVGDGINDAPALARAQVGISLSQATEVAMQSAQVILLQGKLDLLPELHRISIHTVRTIKQNLFWAFFYNVIAIPLAALGFLRPILGALAMAFSDVIVVGNSLRLKVKKLG
ncbi:MAG: cadmium-translocating P-type ATPase [Bacteroidetes bacterium]|nr:MAG: cadmium-translocating P-type ATPase [Bacteroidota bacterium]